MVIFEVESGSGKVKVLDIFQMYLMLVSVSLLLVLLLRGIDLIFLVLFLIMLCFSIFMLKRDYARYRSDNYHLVFYGEWFSVVRGEFIGDFLYEDVESVVFIRKKYKEGYVGQRVELLIKGRRKLVLGSSFLTKEDREGLRTVLIQNVDKSRVEKR